MYISRITGYNQNSFSLSRRQINNPSFEAKKPKELAKLASVTAAALGIPIHFQKINEKEAECEIYKIRQGLQLTELTDAYIKEPSLVRGLLELKSNGWNYDYSEAEVVAIARHNEESPEFAYELTSVLGTNGKPWNDLSQVEEFVQMYKENPELVKKFHVRNNSVDTYTILKLRESSPEFFDKLRERNYYLDLETVKSLGDLNYKYPQAVNDLLFNKKLHFNLSQISTVVPKFDKKLSNELIDLIADLELEPQETKEDLYCTLHNSFLEYPESVKDLMNWRKNDRRYMLRRYSDVSTFAEANNVAPDLLKATIIKDRTSTVFEDFNNRELADYVIKKNALTPLFDAFKEVNPEIKLDDVDLIKTIDTIFKNKVAFVRMIQDGRCNSLVEMASYVSVYNKYPDREITDSMLKNHYGIKSLFRLNS